MAHPDQALWKQGWRANHIPFHLDHVHPLLQRCWAQLAVDAAASVFVPLCGKSLDLAWLSARGHPVIGNELSPVAVRAFFSNTQPPAAQRAHGSLNRWQAGQTTIYCGDFFALRREDLAGVAAVYDRAALTALPEELRLPYIAHLHAILPEACQILLLTVEDLEVEDLAADYLPTSPEIAALYAGYFSLILLHAEYHPASPASLTGQSSPRCIHKAYQLRRSPRPPGGDTALP